MKQIERHDESLLLNTSHFKHLISAFALAAAVASMFKYKYKSNTGNTGCNIITHGIQWQNPLFYVNTFCRGKKFLNGFNKMTVDTLHKFTCDGGKETAFSWHHDLLAHKWRLH
ncbi:hypothetical protein ILYODFUR_010614 [Ilyodon furcidens]|uniref:Uncharacterized protein n=1 Tax=Ilyodon furcidens TaxID=33524 RepID=A0ABV0TV85_9TELE